MLGTLGQTCVFTLMGWASEAESHYGLTCCGALTIIVATFVCETFR